MKWRRRWTACVVARPTGPRSPTTIDAVAGCVAGELEERSVRRPARQHDPHQRHAGCDDGTALPGVTGAGAEVPILGGCTQGVVVLGAIQREREPFTQLVLDCSAVSGWEARCPSICTHNTRRRDPRNEASSTGVGCPTTTKAVRDGAGPGASTLVTSRSPASTSPSPNAVGRPTSAGAMGWLGEGLHDSPAKTSSKAIRMGHTLPWQCSPPQGPESRLRYSSRDRLRGALSSPRG